MPTDAVPTDAPSTLLGVAVLGYADQLVEVDAIAVRPRRRPVSRRSRPRRS